MTTTFSPLAPKASLMAEIDSRTVLSLVSDSCSALISPSILAMFSLAFFDIEILLLREVNTLCKELIFSLILYSSASSPVVSTTSCISVFFLRSPTKTSISMFRFDCRSNISEYSASKTGRVAIFDSASCNSILYFS